MKFKNIILFGAILFILIISISSIYATDDLSNNTNDKSIDNLLENTQEKDMISNSSKTIVVPFDPKNPNEALLAKIQPAIDEANEGDTIIIEGNPVHCHITINKTLNVIAGGGTIDPCPHHTHEGVDTHGVFYITKGGSGSTLQGFSFINKDKAETPFSILIDGANNVTIKDCTMNDTTSNVDKYVGIIIKNANNIKLSNLIIENAINGITIINSTNIEISDSVFNNNVNYAISVCNNSKNINITSNSIINNGIFGINLSSVNNINVLNNSIENNGKSNSDRGSGIYVNVNITKLVVSGNIFLSNSFHAILYDYRTKNLNNVNGADKLTIINNNYFSGHKSSILYHRTYVENQKGNLHYDVLNDIYGSEGEGNYSESHSYVYMQYALIYDDVISDLTYYLNNIAWPTNSPSNNGKYDLSLKLNIKQNRLGVYSVLISDCKGNVAKDFNRGFITFFLNDCETVEPRNGDIYNKVAIQNGIASVDFRNNNSLFKSSSNVITAVFNGISNDINKNINVKLNIKDFEIPGNSKTSLISSNLITYPLSDSYFFAKLVNSKGIGISDEIVTFKVDNKIYSAKSDSNGIIKFKVSLTSKKSYTVYIKYAGNEDFTSSSQTSKITVKTGSAKSIIKASNIKVKRNKKKSLKFKLLTNKNKPLKSQKITVKLNAKSYTLKTDKKGVVKLSIKLKKVKKYAVSLKFLGNLNYKATSKKVVITVVK